MSRNGFCTKNSSMRVGVLPAVLVVVPIAEVEFLEKVLEIVIIVEGNDILEVVLEVVVLAVVLGV